MLLETLISSARAAISTKSSARELISTIYLARALLPCTVFGDPITSDNQRWLTCVKFSDIADTFCIILAVLDRSAWTYPLRNIVLYLVITEDQGLYQEMLYLKQTDMKQVNLDLDAMARKAWFEKQRWHNGMRTIKFLHI